MQGFHSLFGRLVGGETCPFMAICRLGVPGLLQISDGLSEPISGSICHTLILPLIFSIDNNGRIQDHFHAIVGLSGVDVATKARQPMDGEPASIRT
jgi:hypothetical protein